MPFLGEFVGFSGSTIYSVAMELIKNNSKSDDMIKVFRGSKHVIDSLMELSIKKYNNA